MNSATPWTTNVYAWVPIPVACTSLQVFHQEYSGYSTSRIPVWWIRSNTMKMLFIMLNIPTMGITWLFFRIKYRCFTHLFMDTSPSNTCLARFRRNIITPASVMIARPLLLLVIVAPTSIYGSWEGCKCWARYLQEKSSIKLNLKAVINYGLCSRTPPLEDTTQSKWQLKWKCRPSTETNSTESTSIWKATCFSVLEMTLLSKYGTILSWGNLIRCTLVMLETSMMSVFMGTRCGLLAVRASSCGNLIIRRGILLSLLFLGRRRKPLSSGINMEASRRTVDLIRGNLWRKPQKRRIKAILSRRLFLAIWSKRPSITNRVINLCLWKLTVCSRPNLTTSKKPKRDKENPSWPSPCHLKTLSTPFLSSTFTSKHSPNANLNTLAKSNR